MSPWAPDSGCGLDQIEQVDRESMVAHTSPLTVVYRQVGRLGELNDA